MKIKLETIIAFMLIQAYKSGRFTILVDDVRIVAKRLEEKSENAGRELKVSFSNHELQVMLRQHQREFIESFGCISAYMGIGCLYSYINDLDYDSKKLLEECCRGVV